MIGVNFVNITEFDWFIYIYIGNIMGKFSKKTFNNLSQKL